ncbi:PfkB family carbohydrate kinase [Streptomyces sp. SID13031]|uniref:carbohydrate kinase family protein n=1 Tax=Streptomyces sp. SID13031 TaxID=2706046 RepID=UPI0019446D6F|nr:PfkB family carbohydrate kinase [Streptomyces sp. SID13031]
MADGAARLGLSVEASSAVPGELLRSARHVHATSFYRVPELAAGLAVLFKEAKSNKASTSLAIGGDPSGRWDRVVLDAVLRVTDVLLLDAAEAHALTGHPVLADAAGILARRGPLVVVRDGAAGALAHDGSKVRTVGALAVDAAAGGFDAGYVAAMLRGLGRERALTIAAESAR